MAAVSVKRTIPQCRAALLAVAKRLDDVGLDEEADTIYEIVQDMIRNSPARGRRARVKHPHLTAKQVVQIRRFARANPDIHLSEVATLFKPTRQGQRSAAERAVSYIKDRLRAHVHGKGWRHAGPYRCGIAAGELGLEVEPWWPTEQSNRLFRQGVAIGQARRLAETYRFTIADPAPQFLTIQQHGRELIRIAGDGTVTAPDIEAANEAGRVFVESIRHALAIQFAKVKP